MKSLKAEIKWAVAVIAGGLMLGGGALAEDQPHPSEKPEKQETPQTIVIPQTTCPVMGGKIDKKLFVDHAGKRIYVCCRGCIAAVKADPAKYIKKMESAGITLDPAPGDTTTGNEVHIGREDHRH